MSVKSVGYPLIINDRAFEGTGTSIYVNAGTSVTHRRIRVLNRLGIRTSAVLPNKLTLRRAGVSSPDVTDTLDISDLIPSSGTQVIAIDVRTFASDIELITDQGGIKLLTIDENGNTVTGIYGTAQVLSQTKLAGGKVRVKINYIPHADGVNPMTLSLIRTAGPTSPASTSTAYSAGTSIYEIDTAVLVDTSAYTYKLQAVNGSLTVDLMTGISITADATGPGTPTLTGEVI